VLDIEAKRTKQKRSRGVGQTLFGSTERSCIISIVKGSRLGQEKKRGDGWSGGIAAGMTKAKSQAGCCVSRQMGRSPTPAARVSSPHPLLTGVPTCHHCLNVLSILCTPPAKTWRQKVINQLKSASGSLPPPSPSSLSPPTSVYGRGYIHGGGRQQRSHQVARRLRVDLHGHGDPARCHPHGATPRCAATACLVSRREGDRWLLPRCWSRDVGGSGGIGGAAGVAARRAV